MLTSAPTTISKPRGVTRIGAWVDRRGVGSDWRRWLEVAARVGLTDVSLVLHAQDAGKPFTPFQAAPVIGEIVQAYAAAGIRPHVMLWPQPRTAHATELLGYLASVHEQSNGALASAELDAEEQWTRSAWRLMRGAAVARQLREGWPVGLPLAVNGITAALPKFRDLTRVADVLIPQAYTSTYKGQGSQPGARQHAVAAAWRQELRPGAELAMGLAAYGQEGTGGLRAHAAMALAFAAAGEESSRVMYWSLPELVEGAEAEFLRARCQELRRA